MGSDRAPAPEVAGAVRAARADESLHVTLVGDAPRLEALVAPELRDRLAIVNATEVVTMHDHPGQAFRQKPDSSMRVAVDLVEAGKGDALRKAASELFTDVKGFIGNVEGRDLMVRSADIIITDGFTGNVALKSLEGCLLGLAGLVFQTIDTPDAPWAEHADVLKLALLDAADTSPAQRGSAPKRRRGARGRHSLHHVQQAPEPATTFPFRRYWRKRGPTGGRAARDRWRRCGCRALELAASVLELLRFAALVVDHARKCAVRMANGA